MGSRIGELTLRLRVPGELEALAPTVRRTAERTLIVRVIEALEERMHAALGASALVRVRAVTLRWSLEATALDDEPTLSRLAAELAQDLLAEIASQPVEERLRPRSASIVVFVDEPHAEACRLADLADGVAPDRWFHRGAPDAAETWRTIAAAGAPHCAAVISWLERLERVESALALATDQELRTIAAAVPHLAAAVAAIVAHRELASFAHPPRTPAAPRSGDSDAPELPLPSLTGPPGDVHDAPSSDEVASAGSSPASRSSDDAPRSASPTRADAAPAAERDTGETARSATPAPVEETGSGAITESSPIAGAPLTAAEPAAGAGPAASVRTRLAGLFYLVGRVLEVELAEALWTAGIVEGDLLAHVARTLIADGDADDPAWRWFGGAFEHAPPLPEVAPWAAAEVSETVQHALGRRLVSHGVTTTPVSLGEQLDHVSAALPLRAAADPVAAGLVRRAAAALVVMAAARLRVPPSTAAVRDVVRRAGRLVRGRDTLHVIMPAAEIELAHRRAGLDQNPGHVPWLHRRVSIEFAGGESL